MALTGAIRDADAIYFGETQADKVYVGDTVLYEGGFDPTSISGLATWFQASSLALTDGASVSSWTDLSGNGHHAAQATAGRKPTYKTNIVNGKPVVRFDGTDDVLVTGSYASPTQLTVFLVAAPARTSPNSYALAHVADTDWISPYARFAFASSTQWNVWADNNDYNFYAGNTIAANTWELLTLQHTTGVGTKVRENGVQTGQQTSFTSAMTSSTQPVYVGARIGGVAGGEFWQGDIAEALIYHGSLSTGDRDSVEDYLSGEYGIS